VPPVTSDVEAAKKAVDEPAPPATEEKKPTEHKKAADAPAAAAAPAKIEELSVQVLQEGTGAVVKRGDTVTLEYTISYMPKPASEKKDDAKKKDAKGAKKTDAKKNGDDKKTDEKKSEDAKPKVEAKEGDKAGEEKKEAAVAEHKEEPAEKGAEKVADKPADKSADKSGDKVADKSDEKPADKAADKSADKTAEKSADKSADKTADKKDDKKDEKHADAKAAESKPIDPLKPVIVASTKSFTTPFTVKLTESGKPKLIPGLVRGVEGLKVGTRARIMVPAALAYGKEGSKSAGIPPDTAVEIEVLVKDARE